MISGDDGEGATSRERSLAWRQDRHEFHNRLRSQFVDVLALSLPRRCGAGDRAKARSPRQLSGRSFKGGIREGHRPGEAPLRMEINEVRRSASGLEMNCIAPALSVAFNHFLSVLCLANVQSPRNNSLSNCRSGHARDALGDG